MQRQRNDSVSERRGLPAPRSKARQTGEIASVCHEHTIVRPEEVIPLNESELKDF